MKLREIYKKHYKRMKAGKLITPAGEVYKYGSLYCYKTCFNHLQNFRDVEMSRLNNKYIADFTAYLIEKELVKNTLGAILKCLFAVLNQNKHLLKHNLKYIHPKETINNIYLIEDEINKMVKIKLTGMEKLVRDVFCLQANLGLRYSDLKRICKIGIDKYLKKYKGGKVLSLKTQKGGVEISIPIRTQAKKIILQYNYSIKAPCIQYINKYIKVVAKKAGFDSEIVKTRIRGNKQIDISKKKYELITSHTARRSFATNALLAGVQTEKIMLITGHKTLSSFKQYIGVTSIENSIELLKHPFFK